MPTAYSILLLVALLLFILAAIMTATGTSSGRLNLVAIAGILVVLAIGFTGKS
jgi:hypothetical protein